MILNLKELKHKYADEEPLIKSVQFISNGFTLGGYENLWQVLGPKQALEFVCEYNRIPMPTGKLLSGNCVLEPCPDRTPTTLWFQRRNFNYSGDWIELVMWDPYKHLFGKESSRVSCIKKPQVFIQLGYKRLTDRGDTISFFEDDVWPQTLFFYNKRADDMDFICYQLSKIIKENIRNECVLFE